MFKFQNVKKKDAALLLFSSLLMSSAHAMDLCVGNEKVKSCLSVHKKDEKDRNVMSHLNLEVKNEIDDDIENLIEVYKTAKDFYQKTEQAIERGGQLNRRDLEEKIDLLFGKEGSFFWNDKGLVENLWGTESWLWWLKNNNYRSESPNNSGGFENRVARGKTNEEKERIKKFHMDALKHLTEGMLMQDPVTVASIVNGDNQKKKTYPLVSQHMRSIVKNKNSFDWLKDEKNKDYLNWKNIPIKVIQFSNSPFLEDKIHDAHSQCSKDEIGFLKDGMDLYCIYNDTLERIREKPGDYYRLHYKISGIMTNHKSENRSLNYQVIYLNDTVEFSEDDRIRLLDLASEFIDIPKSKADLLDRILRLMPDSDPAENVNPQPLVSEPFGRSNGMENPSDTKIELGVMSHSHTNAQTPHISTNLHQQEKQNEEHTNAKYTKKETEKDKKTGKKKRKLFSKKK